MRDTPLIIFFYVGKKQNPKYNISFWVNNVNKKIKLFLEKGDCVMQ